MASLAGCSGPSLPSHSQEKMSKSFLLLSLALLTNAQADCSFSRNLNDTEVSGMHAAPAATDPASCAAACCSNSSACDTWQWCLPGFSCAPANSCWIGVLGNNPTWQSTGWVSATRPRQPPAGPLWMQLSPPSPPTIIPNMPPVTRPDGTSFAVNSGGFVVNGTPIFPIAGELHYSRVPASAWGPTLRLMKAGGLTTVSTYVIMIHHNEVEGVYDWHGQRNLTAFLQEAAAAGLYVSLRIGPYCHGEVRGGGMPDWLQQVPGISLRTNQTLFMSYVNAWYSAVAAQLVGAMWQQGGPVITVQLDNETGSGWYLAALKAAALAAGIAPPFFVSTGLNSPLPEGAMLPFTGAYPVAFWSGNSNDTASSDYLFANPDYAGSGYPTLWCELGGGIAAVYCTRHRIAPQDIAASAVTAMARSSDLGYYMYSGGSNPQGVLSTLQEHQAFYNGIWDLPVLGYDFVAPIGVAGIPHPHYHTLRSLHALAGGDPQWGAWMAPAPPTLPDFLPSGPSDASTLRWQAKFSGGSTALLFFSTYARDLPFSPPTATRLALNFTAGLGGAGVGPQQVVIPHPSSPPIDFPANTSWAWPVYPPLPGGFALVYALAQPIATVERFPNGSSPLLFLAVTPGVAPELCFEFPASGAVVLESCGGGVCTVEGELLFLRGVVPSRGIAIELSMGVGKGGERVSLGVVILDAASGSGRVWVGDMGEEGVGDGVVRRVAILPPGGEEDATALPLLEMGSGGAVRVRARAAASGGGGGGGGNTSTLALSLCPPPHSLQGGATSSPDGAFTAFSLAIPTLPALTVSITPIRVGTLPPIPPKGPRGYPMAPGGDGTLDGEAWGSAGVWSLEVSGGGDGGGGGVEVESLLRFDWVGDVARLYSNSSDTAGMGSLIADVFYNSPGGREELWTVSLTRALEASSPLAGGVRDGSGMTTLTLRALALRADADAYIGLDSWPNDFGTGPQGSALALKGVEAFQTISLPLQFGGA